MTEREEIERLLQMTGRTLDSLPKHYDIEHLIEIADKYAGWIGESHQIAHQSDVIELLIGALRDALAKAPKWISVEEDLPPSFVSVQVYMTDAGEFPPVREGYHIQGNIFFIPALGERHPVSHWKPFDDPPKEEDHGQTDAES